MEGAFPLGVHPGCYQVKSEAVAIMNCWGHLTAHYSYFTGETIHLNFRYCRPLDNFGCAFYRLSEE